MGMTVDDGKNAGKVIWCEYALAETGLGEFELSTRECAGSPCPRSIFEDPTVYVKCPQRLKYQKEGVSASQIEPKKIFVRVHSKQESVPKFTGVSCNGCQYKGGSYCWGQCTYNIWKRKPDW